MYRPEYYGYETDDEGNATLGLAELELLKNRHGATGIAKAQFVAKYGKFSDWMITNPFSGFPTLEKKLVVPESGNNNVPF